MTVYVETNFLIDLGLAQEHFQSTHALANLAETGRIVLAIPQIALLESLTAIEGRRHQRAKVSQDVRNQLTQVVRSGRPERAQIFENTIGEFERTNEEELQGILACIQRTLANSRVLPIDARSVDLSRELQSRISITPVDSMICAAVRLDLEHLQDPNRCFLSTDAKFLRAIATNLDAALCKSFSSFEAALTYIQSNLA